MHESPNCARGTGQGENGQPGARARDCSWVQVEEGVDAGAAQGARCLQYEQRKALVSGRCREIRCLFGLPCSDLPGRSGGA